MSGRRGSILALTVVLARAACAPAGSVPAPGASAKCDDAWLAAAAAAELLAVEDPAGYPALARRIERAMLSRLACGHTDQLRGLSGLAHALRACRYVPLLHQGRSDGEFARWLLSHGELSRRLFRALGDVPRPPDALRKLRELAAADAPAVLKYPDLAVGFVTSGPLKHTRKQPNAATLVESFRWYARPERPMRWDLRSLPYEALRYLADTRLSLAERRWAAEVYAQSRNPAKAYFDVGYDKGHFRKNRPKKIAGRPYTLQNLRTLGGVCVDQAYFASEVCKALGIPAAIVYGRGGTGVPHSWCAFLGVDAKRRPQWNCQTARYENEKLFLGVVHDPADGEEIADSVLAMAGRAANLPLAAREEAAAAVELARLVRRAARGRGAPNLTVLSELAAAHDRHRDESAERADTSWIGRRRKLDASLVRDLLAEALERNLADEAAWDLLVELRKAGEVTVAQLDRYFEPLLGKTAASHADFSYTLAMRIVPTLPEYDQRRAIYRKAMEVFARRRDLQGRLLIAMGDDLRRQKRHAEALAAYRDAAVRCVDLAEIVVRAASRAEKLLVAGGRPDAAIEMYARLFEKAKKENVSDLFRTQTSHYQLGSRLATLLDLSGKDARARRIRNAIRR